MQKLNVQVIRSSSSGNCTAVWQGKTGLLIDAGIPKNLLSAFLDEAGFTPVAALITHAHRDHLTNAACNYLYSMDVPVYLHDARVAKACTAFAPALLSRNTLLRHFAGTPFSIGDIHISPFAVDHDADGGCFGFRIEKGGKSMAFATDFVRTHAGLEPYFSDTDAIVIESNHDVEMLMQSARPPWVKARIRDKAHLSNEKCADFIERVLNATPGKTKAVFLAHISSECNCRDHVTRLHTERLVRSHNHGRVSLLLTYRDRYSERVSL